MRPRTITVTEDPRGSLSAVLGSHADIGDRLFRRGKRVSDPTGFCRWLGELLVWRATTTEALAAGFEQEALDEFLQEHRGEGSGEDWRRNLRGQLRVLRDQVEFLDSLRSALVWKALESRCRAERLGPFPAETGLSA